MGEGEGYEIIGMNLSLKYGGILLITFLWWTMLTILIASISLLTNGSGRNDRFSSSGLFRQTGLKSQWKPISKMMATSLYNDGIRSESGVSRLVLYRECSGVRSIE